jgi:hypothetical protein
MNTTGTPARGNLRALTRKPDLELCLKRIEAWYHGEVIDRPPVRFSRHNAQHDSGDPLDKARWPSLRDRWHDVDYLLDRFEASIRDKTFRAETFPVYIPTQGPNVYSAFYGGALEFGETTTWFEPVITNLEDLSPLGGNPFESVPFRQLESQTRAALARCGGDYWVGYADLHPSLDCVAAWCGTEALMIGLAEEPEKLEPLLALSVRDFHAIFDHFDAMLKTAGQPSITWLRVPCPGGKFHIPSGDATSMVSSGFFKRFSQPLLRSELEGMDRVVYHVDGKGVAQHLELILAEPGVQAIQWVQGVGTDWPILQWVPLLKRALAAGKSVMVDVPPEELDEFMARMPREGVFLCLGASDDDMEERLLRRVEKW